MSVPNANSEAPFGAGATGRRRMVRGLLYAAVLLGALVVAWIATRDGTSASTEAAHDHVTVAGDSATSVMLNAREAQRIGVTYAAATRGPIEREVRTVGQVLYDETRVHAVAPKVDGWVEQLFVNTTGQPVRRGEPMFALYSPMLVTAQEELLLATRLARDVAGGTPEAVRQAQDLVSSARRRLLYWDVPASEVESVERSGTARRALTLVAPADGFVVEKAVVAGQRIMAGESLYRIADLRVVWVEGAVFEQDLASIRVGQGVSAELEAFPGERWTGRIAYVYPTVDPETRTARVRVELPNDALRLKPGMYATLIVRGTARGDVLSVPRSAVLATGERNLVFLKRADGMLEPREVTIGATSPERIEIRNGLAAGDTVVASATFLVDAESNLGTALGGMGNMPGMDMTQPTTPKDRPGTTVPVSPRTDHSGHEE
ncbi:MAG TPA: efflux RND transporter periplasmic adaptor subunit [Gemmatimonadaceae bacterium]|nr:efflux RND transporter periplasmic adaptor subunit [Gemmatimonadaceae bacterium]